MVYYAHSKEGKEEEEWQLLKDHLYQTAKLASEFSEKFDCKELGCLLGTFHDLGKYSQKFQDYLREKTAKGPDHSTAGAQELVNIFGLENKKKIKPLLYAIMGHHSGLPNGKDNDESCLEERLKKKIENYDGWKKEIEPPKLTLDAMKNRYLNLRRDDDAKTAFAFSFLIRMLFSTVVDADRLNSEEFGDEEKHHKRGNYPSLEELRDRLEKHLSKFEGNSEINKIRNGILTKCKKLANKEGGIFKLTVPTGGGKTLSSMAFAINHAIYNNLDRIIYVIPYTSIIEQNANVFREAFGDLGFAVVEHHSNFDESRVVKQDDDIQAWELSTENWDAPIIVTTTVQFFDSLFSCKPSRCRKLHNIAKSVVILDEAQMLPTKFLYPSLRALEELSLHYKTTLLLCTATQPALEEREKFKGIKIKEENEIVGNKSEVEELYRHLERVNVTFLEKPVTDEELIDKLANNQSVLCIVNTRGKARRLFEMLKNKNCQNLFHLSASMCPEHRFKKIETVKQFLSEGKNCTLISTQVIEAGVDIDFPVLFRETTGIDSIAQASGRCNREDKLKYKGKVFVFQFEEGVTRLFKEESECTKEVRRQFPQILSLEAINKYFELHFWRKGDELDKKKIIERLKEDALNMNFPFREISNDFSVIDAYSIPVIVPYNQEGKSLISALRDEIKVNFKPDRKTLRRLQRFTVNIYPQSLNEFLNKSINYILPDSERFATLENESIYDDDVGIKLEDPYYVNPTKSVF